MIYYYSHNREDYHMKDLIKKVVKAPMFLIFSIIVVLSTMSACILSINAIKPAPETNEYTVTFPAYTDAIEKLEYSIGTIGINSSSQKPEWTWDDWKSVDGNPSAKVTNQNKIKFLVKFKEGYSDFPVRNVRIKSDAHGEDNTSSLLVCRKNENNEIITLMPRESEKINENTSYSSEEITINQDQTLYFSDIIPNSYSLTLNIPVSEEVFDVYYDTNSDSTSQKQAKKISSEYKNDNYVYTLKNIPYGTVANFEMRLKDKYSQLADKNFDIFPKESNDYFLKVDNTSRRFAWEAKENTEINFDVKDGIEITSNKYDIKNTTGKTLYYKNNNSEGSENTLNPGETVAATHGEVYNFYTQNNDALIRDNNISMSKTQQDEKTEYYISDITSNHNISVQEGSTNSLTTITLPVKPGVHFVQEDGSEFEEDLKVSQGTFKFKLQEVEGYKDDFKNIKLYQVGENDTNYTNGTLISPDEDGVYTLEVGDQPIKILVGDDAPKIDVYTIKASKNLLATSNLTMNVILEKDNKDTELTSETDELYYVYNIEHGSDVRVEFFTDGKNMDLTQMIIENEHPNGQTLEKQNATATTSTWKIEGIKDKVLIKVEGLTRATAEITFDPNNTDAEIDYDNSYYELQDGKQYKLTKVETEDDAPVEFSAPYDSTVYLKFNSSNEKKIKLRVKHTSEIISPNGSGYFVIKNSGDIKLEECGISTQQLKVTIFTHLTDLQINDLKVSDNDANYVDFGNKSTREYTVNYNSEFKIGARRVKTNEVLAAKDTDQQATNLRCPTDNKAGTFTLENVTTDKFIIFYNPEASEAQVPIDKYYKTDSNGDIVKDNKGNPIVESEKQLVSARNMSSKYKLVKESGTDCDYDVNFKEYPTDMNTKLGIKVPPGKTYDMCYHVISKEGETFPKSGNDINSQCDKYINDNGGKENLAGCDLFYRYEAPTQLNIKIDYGEKCTPENFIGFQFDVETYEGTIATDIFNLFGEVQYGKKYRKLKNTCGGIGNNYINNGKYYYHYLPTDSLRGLFQIHWLSTTLSEAKNLAEARSYAQFPYQNFSIFNTKYFHYSNQIFYSLLTRIDDLNYVAKDRTFYYGDSDKTDVDLTDPDTAKWETLNQHQYTKTKLLLYNDKVAPAGSVPYREYFRQSYLMGEANDGEEIADFENRMKERVKELNGRPYDLNIKYSNNSNGKREALIDSAVLKGKKSTEPEKVSSGDIDLNIKTKTLMVFEDNPDQRYEDDIVLKEDHKKPHFENIFRNSQIYMTPTGEFPLENDSKSGLDYYGISPGHVSAFGKFKSENPAYSNTIQGVFDIYSLNAFKEIRITPKFDTENLMLGTPAKNPKLTLPQGTKGVKFYKYDNGKIGKQITSSEVASNGEDKENWHQGEKDHWSYDFIIKPDREYDFVPGAVKVIKEGYSVISYEEKMDPVEGTYYIYHIKNFLENNNTLQMPEIQKRRYTITCNDGYTEFYDNETNEQFLKKEFDIDSNFTFRTQPKLGYNNDETLIINTGNDSFKITSDGTSDSVLLPNGTRIERSADPLITDNTYIVTDIQESFSVFSTRERNFVPVTLTYDDSVYYKDTRGRYIIMAADENGDKKVSYVDELPEEPLKDNIELNVDYGSNFYFTIEEREGFDPLTTIVTANNIKLDYENGKYAIKNVTSAVIIKIENSTKMSYKVYFTEHEGLTFKSTDGKDFVGENTVAYGSDLVFKVNISEAYSNSENYKIMVEYSTEGKMPTEIPKVQNDEGKDTDRYILKDIQENVRIYVDGLEHNTYKMKLYNTTGISYYDKYGQEKYMSGGEFIERTVYHGDDFSFKIFAEEGYDISEIKVYSKQEKSGFRKQLLPSNGVYTIEKASDNCTITVENTKKSVYSVEIRTTSGAKCLDDNGNVINSSLTVNHGDDLAFTIALDKAYNHSTPIVTLKGSINTISPVDGRYIISDITENKIIEITGIKKNTYKATFKETEGVIYKNGKNKPFSGSLDAEDGETLYFKITLMDAYDKSSPIVLLNNSKPIAESAGVYSISNVGSDLEISVENVYKNPEEVTMEDVNNVPDKVSTELDISRVVTATKTYLNLSDEEKAEVINLADLKRAQQEAGVINHKSGDISVTGLDWNIKVVVDKLTGNQEKINYMNGKIDRREVLYLYDIYLIDLLTDEVYEIPYGNKVTVTMPAPDLSGYKNEVVVHEKSNGNIEYIDMNITDGTARFEATSFSLFGIAAKKIPNYSDPSGTKIYVSDLVDNEEELQALLGEGVTSQLGDLTENKNDFDLLDGEGNLLSNGKSWFAALYEWILNHELLSVIIILIIGSLLIFWIISQAQKENTDKN